ncbi:MAG: 3-methyl-2-oxobutanoate hydroxymethyltransferase [Anaerolineales bacterium]|nr:3-methyl-2-oxobutanoate hydroxymethyltransferase [Anaerolineales bacterium]
MSTISPGSAESKKRAKISTKNFLEKKKKKEPISVITAYDYPMALAADRAGVDAILVGDSLGMVVLGYEDTLSVTMEDMLHHSKAVARGASSPLLIGDLPFMAYQVSKKQAVTNAGRLLQEGKMQAVKLEGGREVTGTVKKIVQAGIPVMGHLGLTPQSINQLGGYRAQGKTAESAQRILKDALLLEEAGCFSIVLESIPDEVSEIITQKLSIPTIGIGAGIHCDGQVLVLYDLLGMFDRFTPRFVRQYAHLNDAVVDAIQEYDRDVRSGNFPAEEHTIHMKGDELGLFLEKIKAEK